MLTTRPGRRGFLPWGLEGLRGPATSGEGLEGSREASAGERWPAAQLRSSWPAPGRGKGGEARGAWVLGRAACLPWVLVRAAVRLPWELLGAGSRSRDLEKPGGEGPVPAAWPDLGRQEDFSQPGLLVDFSVM